MKENLPAAPSRKLLVVEDEEAIAEICRRVLSRCGFQVDVASGGFRAVDLINESSYNCFLFDIRTPGMDGKELFHWLQQYHPALVQRVAFMSGDSMGGDTEQFLQQTGCPYLLKPFTPAQLQEFASVNFSEPVNPDKTVSGKRKTGGKKK